MTDDFVTREASMVKMKIYDVLRYFLNSHYIADGLFRLFLLSLGHFPEPLLRNSRSSVLAAKNAEDAIKNPIRINYLFLLSFLLNFEILHYF